MATEGGEDVRHEGATTSMLRAACVQVQQRGCHALGDDTLGKFRHVRHDEEIWAALGCRVVGHGSIFCVGYGHRAG